jgi:hypothetical protein
MSLIIENEVLAVEIGKPGNYNGTRFDWTGFIEQVTLKAHKHTFCTLESFIPGKGTRGAGLCNEFGGNKPIGYNNAAVGECFPKLGIGLLTRTSEKAYSFFTSYPVDPFLVQTDKRLNSVKFSSESKPCRGYAVQLEKEISVRGHELIISYVLHNVGTECIATNEYVHNFIAINNKPIGPDYTLRFPEAVTSKREINDANLNLFALKENEIRWQEPVTTTFYWELSGFSKPTSYYWELVHKQTGVGVRESGSEPATAITLWGEPHVVSPEVFVDIHVNPGETQRWNRVFEFFDAEV